jgi:hypothetical protein
MPPGGEFFAAFGKRVASRMVKELATSGVGALARAIPILPRAERLGLVLALATIRIGGTADCAPSQARMGVSDGRGTR